ncbi:dual specificity protein phosphatase family protein [Candidatus Nitrososphaera sp. FF02]|uniref:phosphatase domain-containing protein n=1 Tax=Candidatus Nitrososphaera sp. FF02 TaxID=3398226 RepID=UPI0039E7AAC8
MTRIGDMYRRLHSMVSERPTNFGWVIEGKLAGSGLPVSSEEFGWLLEHGVKSVVTVRESALPPAWTGRIGYMHLQVDDYGAPELEEIDRAVDFIDGEIGAGRPVTVHSAAGKGRTGLILASYLIKKEGLGARQSIDRIRSMRPGSIQSEAQEKALEVYEKYLKSKK